MDKKMMKYVVILVVIILLVVVLSFMSNAVTGGAKYSYEKLEEKLVDATKDYLEDLPGIVDGLTPNTSQKISSVILVNKEYIRDLSEMNKDGVNCVGEVEIFKTIDGHIDYQPYLKCGNKYESVKLFQKVIDDNQGGVVSGSGLYQRVDGRFVTDYYDLTGGGSYSFEYVFRGDEVNIVLTNFINFS